MVTKSDVSKIITLRPTESEARMIEELKISMSIPAASKALIKAGFEYDALKREIQTLRDEKRILQQTLSEYRSATNQFMTGLSHLQSLNKKV